jgi:hypothetical protein
VMGISGVAPAQHGKAPGGGGGRGLLQRCSTSANRSGGRRRSAPAWKRGDAVQRWGGAAQRRCWGMSLLCSTAEGLLSLTCGTGPTCKWQWVPLSTAEDWVPVLGVRARGRSGSAPL